MEPYLTFQDPYLGIYTKSFLWPTAEYNIFIDAGLASGAEYKQHHLESGRKSIVLLTHGHWDHVGCNALTQKMGGEVWIHPGDQRHLSDYDWHWELLFGQFSQDFTLPTARHTVFWNSVDKPVYPDRLLKDGEVLDFGRLRFRVITIPGHSPGSVCFYEENSGVLFTGDGVMGDGFFTGTPQISDFDAYFTSLEKLRDMTVSRVVTDHTDPIPGYQLNDLLDASIVCARRMLLAVEEYVEKERGQRLTVADAAKAIAAAEEKNVGGGTCVSALAALWRMRDDLRAQLCAREYICGI